MQIDKDGTVLGKTEKVPDYDCYYLEVDNPLGKEVTGLRLEALPDETKKADDSERGGKLGAAFGLAAAIVICAVVSESEIGIGFPSIIGFLFLGAVGGYLLDKWLRSRS